MVYRNDNLHKVDKRFIKTNNIMMIYKKVRFLWMISDEEFSEGNFRYDRHELFISLERRD
jgi:hypothetical protein